MSPCRFSRVRAPRLYEEVVAVGTAESIRADKLRSLWNSATVYCRSSSHSCTYGLLAARVRRINRREVVNKRVTERIRAIHLTPGSFVVSRKATTEVLTGHWQAVYSAAK